MKNKFFNLLYEDDSILVIEKKANVLSIQDRFDPTKPNIQAILKKKFENAYSVHRLDEGTSGVMVYAKNKEAQTILQEQFAHRKTKKKYLAIVLGRMAHESGSVDVSIKELPNRNYMAAHPRGKKAFTRYQTLEQFKNYALVEVSPETGRTHQIRVHMKHLGNPLMVDPIYSRKSEFYLSTIKKRYNLKKDDYEKPLIDHLTLHALELTFTHPTSNEEMTFRVEPPKTFKATLNQLRKLNSVNPL